MRAGKWATRRILEPGPVGCFNVDEVRLSGLSGPVQYDISLGVSSETGVSGSTFSVFDGTGEGKSPGTGLGD